MIGPLTHASTQDFAQAISARDALFELISTPWILVRASLFHPWMSPLRATATVLANILEQNDMFLSRLKQAEQQAEQTLQADHDNLDILDIISGEHAFDSDIQGLANWSEWQSRLRGRRILTIGRPSEPQPATMNTQGAGPRRKILTLIQDIQDIQALSASMISQGDPNPPVDQQAAQSWSTVFQWPPKYSYTLGTCPAAVVTFDVSREALLILANYYSAWDTPLPPIDRSLRATLPRIHFNASLVNLPTLAVSRSRNWASTTYHAITDFAGLSQEDLIQFITSDSAWSLQWIFVSLTRCDLAVVVSCSGHKRDLFMSSLVLFIFYLIVRHLMPSMSFWFILASPWILIWYAYSVGPTCFPLVPTCLLSDVISLGSSILPSHITMPPELLCDPTEDTRNTTDYCLKPCSDLGFTGWLDPLAFGVADIDLPTALYWGNAPLNSTTLARTLHPWLSPFQQSLRDRSAVFIQTGSTTAVQANRICSWVTAVTSIPALAFLLSIFMAFSSIVVGIVTIGPSFFGLIAQVISYHRTQE